MPNTSRLFFALWPDDETRRALTRLSQSSEAKEFEWVQPHNFHVTLVFLGSVEADVKLLIEQSVAPITAEPFTLTFDRLSYWRKPKILCLTCPPREDFPKAVAATITMLVAELEAVAASCGLQTDTRPYRPHITLARHARYLPDVNIEPIVWRAEAFCLVESCSKPDGVYYKVIQQWPFIKATANPGQLL